jgi:hypothetical protein
MDFDLLVANAYGPEKRPTEDVDVVSALLEC